MKTFFHLFYYAKRISVVALFFLYSAIIQAQTTNCNFTVSDSIMCLPVNKFVFHNLSQGNGLQYKWMFDDGSFSNEESPIKIYTQAGIYNVTLTTTENGIDYLYSKQIIVAPTPNVSQINIQKTFAGKSYTYISSSTILFGYMFYYWQFADSVTSTLINPVHTYKAPGFYDVNLTVTSNYGCVSQINKIVDIIEYDTATLLPFIWVNNDKQELTGNKFIYKYIGDTTNITSVQWDFGDNTIASGINATKTYTTIGNYYVKISVIKNGISYQNYKLITVLKDNINPFKANFNYTIQADSSTVNFYADTATLPAGTTYSWNFDNGNTSTSSAPSAQFYYAGTYKVTLKLYNSTLGFSDSVTKSITISYNSNNKLISNFTVNDSIQCLNISKTIFTNTSTKINGVQYLWDFGDGTTSTQFEPTKMYSNIGSYNVTLTVQFNGYAETYSKTINVVNTYTWLGKISNDWFNALNWQCDVPNANSTVLIKNTALIMPVISNGTAEFKNITIENGASVTTIGSSINVYGNIDNAGAFNAISSTMNCIGNNLQTISGIIEVGNFYVNNLAGVQIGNATNDSIKIYNSVNLTAGNFNTNDKLVLRSTATQTARLNKVNEGGNVGTLTGNTVVERYFQNKRAWRFYTMPFTASGNNSNYSVKNTFQKYTNVTGVSGGVGYDYNTSYYSLNTWNDSSNKWNNITNTLNTYTLNNNAQFSNVPFYILVRGNKSTPEALKSTELTFSFSGKLQTGTQQINFSGKKKGNYFFVGNPYACPVDLAVIQSQSQGLTGNYYYWDPTLNTNGAYVTISNKGNGVWIATPTAAQKGRYMQSCQAMLFEVADSAGFVKFTESAKSDTTYVNVFGAANGKMDKLTINLYRINNDNTKDLLDGAITIFKDNFSINVDGDDSKKILNPQENIGFVNGNDILAIESRPYVNGQDSIHIYTSNLNDTTQYAIEIVTEYFDTTVQQIVLLDSLLQNKSNANFGTSTWYYFTNKNTIANAGRFSLALKATKPVYGKVENFITIKQDKKIKIEFNVDAEQEVNQYELQYSFGVQNEFATIKTFSPLNNNKTNYYNYLDDVKEKAGNHFYRIKTTTKNNDILYSSINTIAYDALQSINKDLVLFPNPASDKFNIHLYSNNNQWIILKIVDPILGRTIETKTWQAKQGENIFTINCNQPQYKNGLYVVNIIAAEQEFTPIKLLLVK